MKNSRIILAAVSAVAFVVPSVVSAAKPLEIKFWTVFGMQPANKTMAQIIDGFQKENPGIKVTHATPSSDGAVFFEKVLVSLASGTGPDIAWVAPERVSTLYGSAAIIPLGQLEKVGGSIGINDFYKGLTNPKNQYQKKMWGVPFENANLGLIWNKSMFAKAGIAGPPRTWNEMTATAIKLASQDGKTTGVEARYWDWYMEMWLAQKGTGLVNDGAKKITWADKAAIEATKWYTDLQVKHKASASLGFTSKRAAMAICGGWEYDTLKTSKVDFGVAKLPVADDGQPATRSTYKELVIFNKDRQKEAAAWKFVKYLMRDDVFTKWCIATNYLPVKKSQARTDEYQKYLASTPGMNVFLDQADESIVTPPFKSMRSVMDIYQQAINAIVAGKKTVEQALTESAKQAQTFLK